jgi:hypothetical protein
MVQGAGRIQDNKSFRIKGLGGEQEAKGSTGMVMEGSSPPMSLKAKEILEE